MTLLRNVLIFHAGALGDFILSWPLALALGRIFAQKRIIYVTHGQKGKLAEQVLGVESLDIESGWHGLFGDPAALPEPARKALAGAQWIFSFVGGVDDAFAGNVRRLAPQATYVALQARPGEGYARHASDFLLEQLKDHVAVEAAVGQILRSIADRGIGGSAGQARRQPDTSGPLSGGVLLHPGSGSARKNWPLERYIELARRLRGLGGGVRALLGEVEIERWPEQDVARLSEAAEIVKPASYVALCDELSKASAIVTNDTGPGHLSGIIGTPTVCLFGPTDPAVWKPLGPRVKVLRGEPLERIEVEEVINALQTG